MLMLIVVGRLEVVYFSRSCMLVALPGELVRQVRLMEVKHYKQVVIDEMLALESLHSDMMVKIGDIDI